jgi:predicted O-linked N-acetylglucosamine transferase (SPINDLY family)
MAGVVNRLDGTRFEPLLICSRPGLAALRTAIPDDRAGCVEMSLRFDQVVQRIAAAQCDILYHWEVGSDATNYFLPFCRLAPVQCSGWGWPDTSAAPQLDAHLTSAALAPPGSEALYSEALVRLPHLPPFFLRPPTPPRAPSRAHFALDDGVHAYVCAQNLRKVHPDFDAMLAAILRADPRGVVLFVEDAHPIYGDGLRQRWARRIGDVAARIRFLPRLSPPQYFQLMAAADVLLDTPYFGGANTAYDGFAAGIPAVTMPGVFPRGRYTSALYAALDMDDGIAASPEDYARRAVRLASDRDYGADVSARIRERAPTLFEQAAAVTQLQDYFENALAKSDRSG